MGNDINSKRTITYLNDIAENSPVVLSIGNSSRDSFRNLIENGFDVKAKPFAIGYRIAHMQSFIDKSQYGPIVDEKNDEKQLSAIDLLGHATYKLTYDVGNGHSVYSFCMCPGGFIINSSNKKNQLAINGMSYNDRSGKFANAAIVETISPSDILDFEIDNSNNDDKTLPIKMIEFQEKVEADAFALEKGFIPYITSDGKDVRCEEIFKGKAKYCEKLLSVYENCGLKFNLNKDVESALEHFNKIISGFYQKNDKNIDNVDDGVLDKNLDFKWVIAGVETRTSSPVKIDRDENYMCNIKHVYPCGEGLGHGGGIMSSAADGVNVAMAIATKLCDI